MIGIFLPIICAYFCKLLPLLHILIQISDINAHIQRSILHYYCIYTDLDVELCKVGPYTISSKDYIYNMLVVSEIQHVSKSQLLLSLRSHGFKEKYLAQLIIQNKVKDFVNNNLSFALSDKDIDQGAAIAAKGLAINHTNAFRMDIEGSLYMQILQGQLIGFAKNHYRKYIKGILNSIKQEEQIQILEFYVQTDKRRTLAEAEKLADQYIEKLQANDTDIYSFISDHSDSQMTTDYILQLSHAPTYIQGSYHAHNLKPGSLFRWTQDDCVYVYLVQAIHPASNNYNSEQISTGIAQLLFKAALMSYDMFIEINNESCKMIGIDPNEVRKLLV